jgi:hypothetical protein
MEAIDLALKLFRDDLAELTADAKSLINVQWDTRADGPGYWPEYSKKVVALKSRFEIVDKKINKFREQHRQFSDLYNIAVFFGQSAIYASFRNMISTVNSFGYAPNVDTRTLFEPHRQDMKEQIELVEQCRSETTDILISFWKELSK